MALQISARVSHFRTLLCTTGSPTGGVRGDFLQKAGVKFKHFLTPGSPQQQLGGTPVKSPVRGYVKAATRADRLSTSTATATLRRFSQANGSPSLLQGRTGWLGKFALGATLGVGTAALVQSLHTGIITAMSLKINLDSAEGNWKETKGERFHEAHNFTNT